MNTRLTFWLQGSWPRDSSTHVFLAGAIDAIGKAMYGQEWRGSLDVGLQLEPALPLWDMDGSFPETFRAHALLAKHRPELGRKPFKGAVHGVKELSGEEWQAAREVVKQLNKDKLAGVKRFGTVRQTIIRHAEAGTLHTASRPIPGGQYTPIPAWWWNSENLHPRFEMCQINPQDPFGNGFAGQGYCWIFVTRESLERLIAGLKDHQPNPEGNQQAESPLPDVEFYDLVPLPGKKQQVVFRALKEAWKDGRIPKLLTIAQIQDRIDPIVKRMGDRGGASADNIRRALGLKK